MKAEKAIQVMTVPDNASLSNAPLQLPLRNDIDLLDARRLLSAIERTLAIAESIEARNRKEGPDHGPQIDPLTEEVRQIAQRLRAQVYGPNRRD